VRRHLRIGLAPEAAGVKAFLDRAFAVSACGSTIAAELRGGATTFATMAYIVVVNASLLSQAGMPFEAVVFATCAASAIGTVLMAWWANYPFALAPGMGMNAYFAFSVVPAVAAALGPDDAERAWRVGLGLVAWSGAFFLLATWLEVRSRVMRGIPASLKLAVSAGIGLFIAFIGLQSAGIVVADPVTLVKLGDVRSPAVVVAIVGFLVTGALWARKIPGALLIGIVVTTVLAVLLGHAAAPTRWLALPSVTPTFLQWDLIGALDPRFLDILVALLFVDFFDTMGTLVGVGVQGGFMDEHGHLPRDGKALSADATATLAGAALGTSPVTTYIESAAGIAAGARTGLANMVVVTGFCAAMFFAPSLGAVPPFATAPALLIVGALMASGLSRLPGDDHAESLAAFVTTLAIPVTFSISDGMAMGVATYIGTKALGGRAREISPIMWGLGAVFLLRYVLLPVD
jgi:AGZA family xanthine/uracil permease-like MFS transporter